MFPLINQDRENPLELFQIWLNLPKAKKLTNPHFAMLWGDTIPLFNHKDSNNLNTQVRVVAGRIGDTVAPDPAPDSWAAESRNEVAIWTIKMDAGAELVMPGASATVNRSLFFYSGPSVGIDGKNFTSHQAIELRGDCNVELKNGPAESHLLLLQGKPINEPVAQYGPFVMNTQQEIHQAMEEFRQSHFGGWPWPSHEHVHPREKSRFARYPSGREEIKL